MLSAAASALAVRRRLWCLNQQAKFSNNIIWLKPKIYNRQNMECLFHKKLTGLNFFTNLTSNWREVSLEIHLRQCWWCWCLLASENHRLESSFGSDQMVNVGFFVEQLSKQLTGFAIITWNNPKKLEKPCITLGLATCQSLGARYSHVTVGAYGGPRLRIPNSRAWCFEENRFFHHS